MESEISEFSVQTLEVDECEETERELKLVVSKQAVDSEYSQLKWKATAMSVLWVLILYFILNVIDEVRFL